MAMETDGGNGEEWSRRVQVRFVTKLKAPFKAPTASIAIPSNLTRMGLSTLVNNLLEAGCYFPCFTRWLSRIHICIIFIRHHLHHVCMCLCVCMHSNFNSFYLLWPGNADWKHEPFDFLIDGELVRMSLEDFLLAKGISAVCFLLC